MCRPLVGLPTVNVVGVVDLLPPPVLLIVHVETALQDSVRRLASRSVSAGRPVRDVVLNTHSLGAPCAVQHNPGTAPASAQFPKPHESAGRRAVGPIRELRDLARTVIEGCGREDQRLHKVLDDAGPC